MTGVVKLCDHLLSQGVPATLRCPKCKAKRLEIIVVKHTRKTYICKIVCVSITCRKRVVYDVTGGFPVKR